MLREAESFRPKERYLRLLDGAATRIWPDEPRLEKWFEAYREQHRARLAADLHLVERHVPAGARLLDCGAPTSASPTTR